jgi:cell wall-associated NlpC family hydrolase
LEDRLLLSAIRRALGVSTAIAVLTLSPGHLAYAAPAEAPFEAPLEAAAGTDLTALARQYIGTPYAWGGSSPRGFDCTGFVMFVYRQFDIELPRSEAGQLASGPRVASDDLQAGDVVVFQNTYRYGLSHTGIYLGDGRFIHSANERTGVVVSNIWDSYWGPRYVGASRPLA